VKFRLEIELGNDARQTYADISGSVQRILGSVQRIFSDFARRGKEATDDAGGIYDANGNKVGFWEVSE
jgi:hypothetical protein